jgi:RNA polymerase sigma-70 factor (ECF subfamily)
MGAMSGTIEGDLSAVIASAAAGDELAFGRIVAAFHADMVRTCLVVTRDQAIADEAVAAAWSIAWRRLGQLRQPDRVRAWLVSVAVNEARQLTRRRRRRALVEIPVATDQPAGGTDPAAGVVLLDLQGAVERLGPDDRALLALRYVAGFDASELGRALGISPAGVRQRLKRLLDGLRAELSRG